MLFASPDLWSTILVKGEHLSVGRGILAGAAAWLDKSDHLPLDVLIHIESAEADLAIDLVKSLLDLFGDHKCRLRKLSLRLPSGESLNYSAISLLSNTPLLEDLQLCLPSSESTWRKPQLFSLPFAPKLSVLRCIGWKAFCSPRAPLHNLLEIRFDHFVPHSLAWELLANLPNLQVVQLGLENDGMLAQDNITTFRDLRRLDLRARYSFEDDLDPLFGVLSAPNLEELSLSISPLATFPVLALGSTSRLLQFLKTSSYPRIDRLSMHNVRLSSADAMDVFNALSCVTTLDLSGTSLNGDLLALLSAHAPRRDVQTYLPLLKSIVVDTKGRKDTDIQAMLNLIGGRLSVWTRSL